jgi:hypothetical protein
LRLGGVLGPLEERGEGLGNRELTESPAEVDAEHLRLLAGPAALRFVGEDSAELASEGGIGLEHRPTWAAEIVGEVRGLVEKGIREVTLLGQIVNMYGRREIPVVSGKSAFVQLLEELQRVDGLDRIRFTSPHPRGMKDDLIGCFFLPPHQSPCTYTHQVFKERFSPKPT